ncbi:MAG: hypothetical protein HY807_08495 [Nitrospirae bacterium]|nr:hypothetical protein [Nitrospirota bacterium]
METKNWYTKRDFFKEVPFFIKALFFFIITFYIFFYIQFSVPWLVGYDGFFHIKYSAILAEKGFIDKLPWLQYTIHKDAYRDHHLLFHYLVVPFTYGNPMIGGKYATVLFASFMGLALYILLNSAGVRLPSLWSFAAIMSSHPFLFRMSLLRVQSLSLAALLLIFLFCMKRQYLMIYISSVIFVWLYDAFPLLIIFSLVFILSGWLVEKRPDIKIFHMTLLGIVTGLVVNPYFPGNVTSIIYNISRTFLENPSGIQLGSEWKPYQTWDFVRNSLPVFLVFPLTILFLPLVKKIKREEYASVCLSLLFLFMTLKSRRFVEYWPVFAFLSASLVVGRRVSWQFILAGFILLLPLMNFNFKEAVSESSTSTSPESYLGSAKWLEKNTSAGDIVFNADWDDFPFLFYYNAKNYYIVGLDPMYLYSYDKDKSALYRKITKGQKDETGKLIMEEFNSRYVFLDRDHDSLYERLSEDPLAKKVFEDSGGYVFKLSPEKDEPQTKQKN